MVIKSIEKLIVDSFVVTEVATPQVDQFHKWGKPLLIKNDISKLNKYWSQRVGMFRRWNQQYGNINNIYK